MITQPLPMPCGCAVAATLISFPEGHCAVDLEEWPMWTMRDESIDESFALGTGEIVECRWCATSFSVDDWISWLQSTSDAAPMPIMEPRRLVHFGYSVCELVDEVNRGGLTLVRDCGNGGTCLLPIEYLSLARN